MCISGVWVKHSVNVKVYFFMMLHNSSVYFLYIFYVCIVYQSNCKNEILKLLIATIAGLISDFNYISVYVMKLDEPLF